MVGFIVRFKVLSRRDSHICCNDVKYNSFSGRPRKALPKEGTRLGGTTHSHHGEKTRSVDMLDQLCRVVCRESGRGNNKKNGG